MMGMSAIPRDFILYIAWKRYFFSIGDAARIVTKNDKKSNFLPEAADIQNR
jgi:hypothetical protein